MILEISSGRRGQLMRSDSLGSYPFFSLSSLYVLRSASSVLVVPKVQCTEAEDLTCCQQGPEEELSSLILKIKDDGM